jgi:hypothetical protein
MRIGLIAVVSAAAMLAGCSQSEADQRASLKSQYVDRCKQRSGEMQNPSVDKNKYCECGGRGSRGIASGVPHSVSYPA